MQQVVDDANYEARPLHKEVKVLQLEKCRVTGSPELLRSAVENVVRNAVRYTAIGSAVEVTLRWKLDTALLTVRDHGPGVPETELQRIFEPFYRVSEARDRASGGAGLDPAETRQLDTVRRFGTVGALLMGLGSLGAGTAPVLGNPVVGHLVLGLFPRMPTASLAVAYSPRTVACRGVRARSC